MAKEDDFLSERQRAEDILLGALGYAEDAKIVSVQRGVVGYFGVGIFSDGAQFDFSSEDEVGELEEWALAILAKK